MKKTIVALLALALACMGIGALADGPYSEYAGDYNFCSGVGAWSTDITLMDDGSFIGHFEDHDYWEDVLNGERYEGVLYFCDFSGRLSQPEYVDERGLICKVSELDYEMGAPYVADDPYDSIKTKYEPVEPYGLSLNDTLRFYKSGTRRNMLPEGFISWLWFKTSDENWETLPFAGIYNETADAGFSNYDEDGEMP